MKRRIVALMMSLAMVFTMIPASAAQAEGTGTSEAAPTADEEQPSGENIALKATASASYKNVYGGVDEKYMNDGELATGDTSTVWNSWGTDDPLWVALTWDSEQEISSMRVIWWAYNDGGVSFPKSAVVEYLNDSDEWVEISDVGVEADTSVNGGVDGNNKVWNTVTFKEPVKTKALRMEITRQDDVPAQNGVGISEWEVYSGSSSAPVEPEVPTYGNVALKAVASATYENSPAMAENMNNGELATDDAATSWNNCTWNKSDGIKWPSTATLTWEGLYSLDDMRVMWWQDGGGVLLPSDCYVEYLNADGVNWTRIADVGVEGDGKWNEVKFEEPVKTSALRLTMNRGDNTGEVGVGISEWEVNGIEVTDELFGAKISGATRLSMGTSEEYVGSTIPAAMSGKATYEWSVDDETKAKVTANGAKATLEALDQGTVNLKLKVTADGISKETTYEVTVEGIESIDPYTTTTAAGVAPILPDSVVANGIVFDDPTPSRKTQNNGVELGESFNSKLIPVTWDKVSEADYAKAGNTFTVNGKAHYAGKEYDAKAEITVKEPAKVAGSNRTVTFENVQLDDSFWMPKQETNATASLNKAIYEIEQASGGEPNFDNAIKKLNGEEYGAFRGYVFQDSDIYKSIEAISYTLSATQNETSEEMAAQRKKLADKVNSWIEKIEKVQYADGYIDTHFTLRSKTFDGGGQPGTHRWNEFSNHEMYNAGHFLESVVAYTRYREGIGDPDYRLYVAGKRFADEIVSLFGPNGKRHEVPGHEEIELGLVKFAKLAEEYEGEGAGQKYYDTAKTLIDRRGEDSTLRDSGYSGGTYSQDLKPFKEETNAVGHSVRAGYFYTGVTDIAATLPDGDADKAAYLKSLDSIWDSVTNRKSYITGGIGTTVPGADSEGFGDDYVLPNDQSYCEICAAIAFTNWNQRMNLLYEDGKYADVVEKDLYNAILVGTNLDGNRFYYSTLLEVDGGNARSEWFACACCPPNLMRTIASLSGYMYTVHEKNVFVNMYVGSNGTVNVDGTDVGLKQETNYPWEGAVKLTVSPEADKEFTLKIRVPGWVQEQENKDITIKVNGEAVASTAAEKGYISVTRTWKKGDVVDIDIPMEIRMTTTDLIPADKGKVALQRGPIVYCMEKAGNAQLNTDIADFDPLNFIIPSDAKLTATYNKDLLNGVVEITGDVLYNTDNGAIPAKLQAVPYYAWNNRGDDADYEPGNVKNNSSKMLIWAYNSVPEKVITGKDLADKSLDAKVSSDYTAGWENLEGIKADWTPESSFGDGKHSWGNWPQDPGSEHWVQYDWDSPITTNKMDIYWYDDMGGTRVPGTLTIKYLKDGGDPSAEADWLTAEMKTDWTTAQERDKFNTIEFGEITTKSIRLVMTVHDEGQANGICRWKVYDYTSAVKDMEALLSELEKSGVDGSQASAEKLEYLRKTYELLPEELKSKITNYNVLTEAEKKQEELEKNPPASVDKKALNDAITAAQALKEADYTADSWKKFSEALTAAQAAAAKADATQAEVDAAAKALTDAQAALVRQAQADVGVKVSSVKFSAKTYKVLAGKKLDLSKKVTVAPNNATNKALKWTVSNKKYATVSAKGVVSAKTAGAGKTVTVTAAAADGSKKIASAKVKITDAVKKITLKAAKSVKAGKSVKVKATVNTIKKKNAKVTLKWTVSSKKYATVSKKGVVKTKKAGAGKTVKVTAAATDGSGKKATLKIKIKK